MKSYCDGLRFALLKIGEKISMAVLTEEEQETLVDLRDQIEDELQAAGK